MAGRPDHADPGPRRLPARLPGHGGRADRGRRPRTWSRSTSTWRAQPGRGPAGAGPRAALGPVPRLRRDWRTPWPRPRRRRTRPTAARLAASRIAARAPAGAARRRAITAASPPESLHELRKRCKELRYLLEFFGSLYDPGEHWRAVRELKALQDCLGEFQDTRCSATRSARSPTQMMAERAAPAATLLAMGEIAAGLAAPAAAGAQRVRRAVPRVRQPGRARAGSGP